ncbi:MAG TPA: thiamine phosphate synthase [Gammaproteobacteria bacterium]
MKQLRGFYAITDEKLIAENIFTETVEQALLGGARIIQYRDKSSDTKKRLSQASALKIICDQHNAVLIINDDIELALEVDADGVHIGIHDMPLTQARKKIGHKKIIGVSCYNKFELAEQAVTEGADYIAFGSFFSSQIKPHAAQATPDLLIKAKQQFDIPVCSIGGITSDNANLLIESGADMVAIISDIYSSDNVLAASQRISQLFEK